VDAGVPAREWRSEKERCRSLGEAMPMELMEALL
jgi:hypothetical protein|tara:strand:- start:77 stop:178 length:102 start_codon:yes stop_codon:yes gene_type:complete